jgi:hypothetical protein
LKLETSHPQVKATAAVLAQLDDLRPELRCAFGASCSERLFPMYQAFSLESDWGDVPKLRRAIDELWDVALLKRGTDKVYTEADLIDIAPISSEHAGRFVAGAQLAVACVIHAWNALTAPDSTEAARCSVVNRDCISEYLQWVAAPIFGETHEVPNECGEMIEWFGHPLMDHEMKKQFADLELLHRRRSLDEWTAMELRSAGARGIAPFIRSLICAASSRETRTVVMGIREHACGRHDNEGSRRRHLHPYDPRAGFLV